MLLGRKGDGNKEKSTPLGIIAGGRHARGMDGSRFTQRQKKLKVYCYYIIVCLQHRAKPVLVGVQGGRLAMNLGGRCPNSTSTSPAAGPCWLVLPRLVTASFSLLYVT